MEERTIAGGNGREGSPGGDTDGNGDESSDPVESIRSSKTW